MGALSLRNSVGELARLEAEEGDDIADSLIQSADGGQGERLLELIARSHLFPGGAERGFSRALNVVRYPDLNIFQLEFILKKIQMLSKK